MTNTQKIKQSFILSNPYLRRLQDERIKEIQNYFNNLRSKIISSCLPNILTKENNDIEYIYPEYINEGIKYINDIEKDYLKEVYD
jgi:hypothetical protein